jgi:hypothetical protein
MALKPFIGYAWHAEQPVRLQQRTALASDPDPKALACYGLWCDRGQQVFSRFVTGRPVSHVTRAFVEWTCGELAKQGEKVLVLIWDNASWHVSEEVRGEVSEFAPHRLPCDVQCVSVQPQLGLSHATTPPSACSAERQIAAGTSGAVQAKSPSLLAWFGIENSLVVRQTPGRSGMRNRSSRILSLDNTSV